MQVIVADDFAKTETELNPCLPVVN